MRAVSVVLPAALWLCAAGSPADTVPAPGAEVLRIPQDAEAKERGALERGAYLLSRGQFGPAGEALRPLIVPEQVRVFVDWTPVGREQRDGYQKALEQALSAWNSGLRGRVSFAAAAREEDADLTLLFEKEIARLTGGAYLGECLDLSPERLPGPTRQARVRISLNVPYTETPHSTPSFTHLTGQALGAYLGLGPSPVAADLMSPDNHAQTPALQPSPADLQRVADLQALRLRLLEACEKRVALRVPAARVEVENAEINLGEVTRGSVPRVTFLVHNTGEVALEIQAKSNCGCVVPAYDRSVPPGGTGKITAELRTPTLRGQTVKTVELLTNDPRQPLTTLRLLANVVSVLRVLPSETPVIPVSDRDPVTRELVVRVGGEEPIELTAVQCSVPFVRGELAPVGGEEKGRAYRVRLTSLPEAPVGRTPFIVTVTTNSLKEPFLTLSGTLEGGILTVPPAAYLGTIRPETTFPLRQVVTVLKRAGEFRVRKVSTDDPQLTASFEAVKEGSQYRVVLFYAGGAPAGSLRRTVFLETDDPRQPRVAIPVQGIVQGTPP
jgi:hypothetical protein